MQGNLLSGMNLSQEEKVLEHLIKFGFINTAICKKNWVIISYPIL